MAKIVRHTREDIPTASEKAVSVRRPLLAFSGAAQYLLDGSWKQVQFVVQCRSKAECVRKMNSVTRFFTMHTLNKFWYTPRPAPYTIYDALRNRVAVTFVNEPGVWIATDPHRTQYKRLV